MTETYKKKKKHIYAYRRRNAARNLVRKLDQISAEMHKKDLKELDAQVSNLSFDIAVRLGLFDDVRGGREVLELLDERKEEKETETPMFIQPVACYVCPRCKKAGYLFLPNIDTEASKLERYILHVPTTGESPSLCRIPPLKTDDLILILKAPTEGIITVT